MKDRRLPPPTRNPRTLMGPNLLGYTVGGWCPTPDGSGPATAVGVSLEIEGLGDVVLRLKSPAAVDEMVQALLRHKRSVWPDAP